MATIGRILPADSNPRLLRGGKCTVTQHGQSKHYLVAVEKQGGEPFVKSAQSGRLYTMSWGDIVDLAVAAGIDEDEDDGEA